MGTMTITTTAAQDARLVEAFGARLGLGRNATGQEVKQAVISYISDTVHQYDVAKRKREAEAAIERISPT